MGDIGDFFNSNVRFERYEISAGTVAGRIVSEVRAPKKLTSRDNNETTYAQEHIIANRSQILQSFSGGHDGEDADANERSNYTADDIYDRYNFNMRTFSNYNLPIMLHEREILDAIETNQAIVLQAATGSGKTTQVPQFILDDARAKRRYCSIVVTQPRRIAASSNAKRVATERGWEPSTIVGYQIGLDQRANFSEDTRILYCTTGVLLERLIQLHDFGQFTHIILDEVHERSKEIDFLLIVIKKLLAKATTKPNVKFIFMSATFDVDAFAKYFELPNGDELVPAQIIRVDEKSNYKVSEFYIDDLMPLSPKSDNNQFLFDDPGIGNDLYSLTVTLINRFESIDAEEFSMVRNGMEKTAVLVFLPGINEINRMRSKLMENWSKSNPATKLLCVALHSMANEQQRALAMQSTEPNVRKVILATNIAESSITVPDVKYVIDFCLMRTLAIDRTTNFTSLQLSWTARNNCRQRMGRAGRVMDGRCYRLVTKYFYENVMLETLPSELIRSPLENIVLKVKKLNLGSPVSVLALAMDKPKLSAIATTILLLKEAGGLLRHSAGLYNELDGDLTSIGRIMADLPCDIKISRFIILGHCFGVLEECLIIGAALSCRRKVFKFHFSREDGMRSYASLLEWANGSGSDLFAIYNAYKVWSQKHECNDFGGSDGKGKHKDMKRSEVEWADKYGIDLAAMYECKQMIEELSMRLKRLYIDVRENSAKYVRWNHCDKALILKVVIAGAFYPNFFVHNTPEGDYSQNVFRTIDGHDPRNTVYFKGFPRNNIRCLYTKAIKNIFVQNGIVNAEHLENMRVLFDDGTEKAYVSFKSMNQDSHRREYGVECMPGKIEIEVYKAVKMRKMRIQHNLRVIKSAECEMMYAQNCGLEIDHNYKQLTYLQHLDRICVPRALVNSVIGYVTHIRSCNQFWFQPMEQFYETKSFSKSLAQARRNVVKRFDSDKEISVGQVLLVKTQLSHDTAAEYYRAKVLHINPSWQEPKVYRLFLIDFGITDYFEFDYLRNPQMIALDFMKLPPRCFECSLAELQPSTINCPDGKWPSEAIKCFEEFIGDGEIEAEIYSVTNDVVHVFIHSPVSDNNLNEELKKLGFAEFAEESYASQTNHKERTKKQNNSGARSHENPVESTYIKHLSHDSSTEVALPPRQECKKEIQLQGPFSPLEISVYPMTEACRVRTVTIDSLSVNSVLLDNDPHQKSERYIIAASVSETPKMNDILLRATTILPTIRAFGPLMALIFCPTMEMKRNNEKTKYVTMRTGLGYDYWNEQPIFEEHDMIFNLDTEITVDDIKQINQIRYCLNTLLCALPGQGRVAWTDEERTKLTLKIKELLIRLLKTTRKPIEVQKETKTFSWNSYDANDIFTLKMDEIYGNRAIFPSHRTVKIFTEDELYAEEMRKHCDYLKMLAKGNGDSGVNQKILCKLCMCWMDTLFHVRGHLKSTSHCNKYTQMCQD